MYKLEWSCKSNFLLSWLQFCLYPNHDFALRNRFYTGYISICSSVPTHPSVIPVSKVPKSLSMFVNPHKIRGDGNSKPKKIQHLSGLEKLRVVCVDRREFQLVLIYVVMDFLFLFVSPCAASRGRCFPFSALQSVLLSRDFCCELVHVIFFWLPW